MIEVIASIYVLLRYVIYFAVAFTILLMLIRQIMNSLDVNPFTWHAMTTRQLSDPFLDPVKRGMRAVNLSPKYAPLVTILLALLIGYIALDLIGGTLNLVAGIMVAVQAGSPVFIVGILLYGMLSLYGLMIMVRIILSWGMVGYRNRYMRFLIIATDPLLIPLQKKVPRVGMFDISPMIALIIVWIAQALVQLIFLRGFPLRFFG